MTNKIKNFDMEELRNFLKNKINEKNLSIIPIEELGDFYLGNANIKTRSFQSAVRNAVNKLFSIDYKIDLKEVKNRRIYRRVKDKAIIDYNKI